jgi:hypothetical protein
VTGPAVEPSAAVLPFRRPRRRIPLAQLIREETEAKLAIGDAVIEDGDVAAATDAWLRAMVSLHCGFCEEYADFAGFPPEFVARWGEVRDRAERGAPVDEPTLAALRFETAERSNEVLQQWGYEPRP